MNLPFFDLKDKVIEWDKGDSSEFPFFCLYTGNTLTIRVNDFPEEHLYTLFINGKESDNFDDWPRCWTKPKSMD